MYQFQLVTILGQRHGYADRRHREPGFMSLAGNILPQPEIVRSEAVDGPIGHLNVDLAA